MDAVLKMRSTSTHTNDNNNGDCKPHLSGRNDSENTDVLEFDFASEPSSQFETKGSNDADTQKSTK